MFMQLFYHNTVVCDIVSLLYVTFLPPGFRDFRQKDVKWPNFVHFTSFAKFSGKISAVRLLSDPDRLPLQIPDRKVVT